MVEEMEGWRGIVFEMINAVANQFGLQNGVQTLLSSYGNLVEVTKALFLFFKNKK